MIAERIAQTMRAVTYSDVPIRIRAWDGSEAGPTGTPVLAIKDKKALRRLVWSPGELGIAQAYLAGEIDVDGDLGEGLAVVWGAVRDGRFSKPKRSAMKIPRLVAAAARLGAIGPKPKPLGAEAKLTGGRHSRDRDRGAVAHHYDLSNEFYETLLDASMAYSCGFFDTPPESGSAITAEAVAQAQHNKLDMVCRKLELAEGKSHLDTGCGWGSLICHAAQNYGTRSTGVTLSRLQFEYVTDRVRREGLGDRVAVVHADYRDIADGRFDGQMDAVSTIEMGEHVGDAEYPGFAKILYRVLKPGGRALVQQMSRGSVRGVGESPGGGQFIETYVAPDMHMKPLGTTIALLGGAGFEIRDVQAMREHYAWTVKGWENTLDAKWDEICATYGEVTARVWKLYLAGGGLAFAENRMGVDQILCSR